MGKLTRHQERIIALQVLYSLDIKKEFSYDRKIIELDKLQDNNQINLLDKNYYFQKLIDGVIENKEKLDTIIKKLSINWDLDRIAPVPRNILRIALFEINNGIPEGVAINEAVELAKEFDSRETAAFINGILAKKIKL